MRAPSLPIPRALASTSDGWCWSNQKAIESAPRHQAILAEGDNDSCEAFVRRLVAAGPPDHDAPRCAPTGAVLVLASSSASSSSSSSIPSLLAATPLTAAGQPGRDAPRRAPTGAVGEDV